MGPISSHLLWPSVFHDWLFLGTLLQVCPSWRGNSPGEDLPRGVHTDVSAARRPLWLGGGVSAQVALLSEEPVNEWVRVCGAPTRAVGSRCPGRTDGPGEEGWAHGRPASPWDERYIQGGWVSQEGLPGPSVDRGGWRELAWRRRQTHRERWGK